MSGAAARRIDAKSCLVTPGWVDPQTHYDGDTEAMALIVGDGLRAGAVGFTTSRTPLHRASDGEPVPGTFADPVELLGIGGALGGMGAGVVGVETSFADEADEAGEIEWMTRLSVATGRPVTFALTQRDHDLDQWRRLLTAAARQ